MLNVQFDAEALREIIREEMREVVKESIGTRELPPLLTKKRTYGVASHWQI